jgi:hypothetical protein
MKIWPIMDNIMKYINGVIVINNNNNERKIFKANMKPNNMYELAACNVT